MSTVMHDINVIQTHTNLVSSRIVRYQPYTASVVCDTGCEVYLMIIKMGGVDITSTAWDSTTNVISITSVTADVDIECYAMHTMPSDYVRVDGIKAGGTGGSGSYLDTGYTCDANSRLELKTNLNRVSIYNYYATSKNDNYSLNGSGWFLASANQQLKIYNNKSDSINTGLVRDANNENNFYELVADYYKKTHTVNGGTSKTITTKTSSDDGPMTLFRAFTAGGSLASSTSPNTIGYFHIYDYATTSYVRYYIPCLNDSGVAGFWDAARGVFQGSSNSTAFQPVYVQDNLIAHYDGIDNAGVGVHDASATTWKDLKGSNDATTENAVTWSDNYLDVTTYGVKWFTNTDITAAISNHDFTLEYVVSPSGMSSQSAQCTLSSTRDNSSTSSAIQVFHKSPVYLNIRNNTILINTGSVLSNNTVAHVVIRKNGTKYDIIINGEVKGTKTSTASSTLTGTYMIGGDYANYLFNGKFYAHRIYTKALTNEEIIGNYNIDKLRFNF